MHNSLAVFSEKVYAIYDSLDCKYFTPPNGFSAVTAEPISTDQYYVGYSAGANSIIHVNSGNTKRGFFAILMRGLKIGDIIEAEAEYRAISGAMPHMDIEECAEALLAPSSNASKQVTRPKQFGEWETLRLKYIVTNSTFTAGHHRICFGLATSENGEFYIKNMRVKTKRRMEKTTEKFWQAFEMKNNAIGKNWIIRSEYYGNSGGVITYPDDYTIRIDYTMKFKDRTIVIPHGDAYASSPKYDPRPTETYGDHCLIKLRDILSSNFVDLNTVEFNTHFGFAVFGEIAY